MKRAAALLALAIAIGLAWFLLREGASTADSARGDSATEAASRDFVSDDAPLPEPVLVPLSEPEPVSSPAPPLFRAPQVLDGELTLDEDGTGVTGRVVDRSGSPVASASLLLVEDNWGHHGDYSETVRSRAVSDAAGGFRLWSGRSGDIDMLRVVAVAEGWPPWIGRVAPLGDGSDVVLGAVESLPLRLVFEDGSPVAAASVAVEDPSFERRESGYGQAAKAMTVGSTDAEGRLRVPVFAARREISLVVRHPQHRARHEVGLEAWRVAGRGEWTLRVPAASAFELRFSDWPGKWPQVRLEMPMWLELTPFVRDSAGALVLAHDTPFIGTTVAMNAAIKDGVALVGPLEAEAYQVSMSAFTPDYPLIECWRVTPGITHWSCPMPPPPNQALPFVIDVAITGDEAGEVWSNWEWTVNVRAATGEDRPRPIEAPGGRIWTYVPIDGPVRLSIAGLGEAGVRTDVPGSGTYKLSVDADTVRALTGGLRLDFSGLSRPPRAEEVHFYLTPEGGDSMRAAGHSGVESHGIAVGRYVASIVAAGVAEGRQPISIEAGRTTVLQARPAAQTTDGVVRGRLRVTGDDSWIRLVKVVLRGPGEDFGFSRLGQRSFRIPIAPGHYQGTAFIGRLPAPDGLLAHWHDTDMLDSSRFRFLPVSGEFECDVRAGETTDVVVDVDIGGTCLVLLTAPSEVEAVRAGHGAPQDWSFHVRRAGDSTGREVTGGYLGGWRETGTSVRLAAGSYDVVAQCWDPGPGIRPPVGDHILQASFEVPADARELTVALQPPAPADSR